jgi:hypothetical protein
MREISPGIIHWQAVHPNLGIDVSSYLLAQSGVVLDPIAPPEGFELLREFCEPAMIVLTNRHHTRDAAVAAELFSVPVRVSEPGVADASERVPVAPFAWGESLAPGVTALEVGAICPDESAIHFGGQTSALALADGAIRYGADLHFVPDQYIGDDPEIVKQAIRDAYRPLLELEFENLLVAHGNPLIGGAHAALAAFVEG